MRSVRLSALAALSAGLGYLILPLFGALLASVGLVIAVWSAILDRRPKALAGV